MLPSFSTVPHVMVGLNRKTTYVAAVVSHNVSVWCTGDLICDSCGMGTQPQRGYDPQIENPVLEDERKQLQQV